MTDLARRFTPLHDNWKVRRTRQPHSHLVWQIQSVIIAVEGDTFEKTVLRSWYPHQHNHDDDVDRSLHLDGLSTGGVEEKQSQLAVNMTVIRKAPRIIETSPVPLPRRILCPQDMSATDVTDLGTTSSIVRTLMLVQ